MNQRILNQLEQALISRTKKGNLVFNQDNLAVSKAGTFAVINIGIKHKEPRGANPDPELKPHHSLISVEVSQEQIGQSPKCILCSS